MMIDQGHLLGEIGNSDLIEDGVGSLDEFQETKRIHPIEK